MITAALAAEVVEVEVVADGRVLLAEELRAAPDAEARDEEVAGLDVRLVELHRDRLATVRGRLHQVGPPYWFQMAKVISDLT